MMNRQGRPSTPQGTGAAVDTVLGHRGLDHEEALIFELGQEGRSGVDLPEIPAVESRLGGLARQGAIGLPGLSEPQVVRQPWAQKMSFCASGMPVSGPASPRARRSSAARAWARLFSASTLMKALSAGL